MRRGAPATPRRGGAGDPGFLLLAILLLARLVWLAPRLLVDDLNLDYAFAAGDAWDWIANGLWLAGAPVRWSARPPLLPLALASLAKAGWIEAWPVVAQGLWTVTLVALYRLLRRQWRVGVALAATLVLGGSHTLNLLSLEVMADLPAACLILLALAAVVAAAQRPAWYAAAGGLAALAALASPIGLVALPAAGAAVAAGRRRHLRDGWLWLGAALPVAAAAGWWLARRALLAGDPPLRAPGRLVRPHLDDLDGTLWTAAVVVGWPALALAIAGGMIALRRVFRRRDPDGLRTAALVAVVLPLAFFAVVYDFPDARFLAYAALPAAALVAEGLAALRPAAARAVAWVAAVALAAWPVVPPSPRSLPVLPPSLYLQARGSGTPEGALRVEPATAGWRLRGIERVAAASWPARVARAHAADEAATAAERLARRRARETAAAAALDVEGVLFLDAATRSDRYRVQSQLGNALRRRVRFVPEHLFAGRWEWLAAGGVEPVGEVGGATLWRVTPPGLDGPWLLASQAPPAALVAAPPPAPRLGPAPPDPASASPPSPPPAGRAAARRLAAALPGRNRRVALLLPTGPPPPAAAWLPFLLDTTELYVLRPSDLPAGGSLFEAGVTGASRRFGPLRLTPRRWRGEPVAVIDLPASVAALPAP